MKRVCRKMEEVVRERRERKGDVDGMERGEREDMGP